MIKGGELSLADSEKRAGGPALSFGKPGRPDVCVVAELDSSCLFMNTEIKNLSHSIVREGQHLRTAELISKKYSEFSLTENSKILLSKLEPMTNWNSLPGMAVSAVGPGLAEPLGNE